MQNTLLFGQYRIEETIGAGGMAVVYKAWHTSLDKYFAIKKLSDSLTQNSEARERFVREAKTHSRLEHPNIVKFHDILQDQPTGNVYIVMEYVEGRTLAKMIGKETGPIPFEKAWPIFHQILDGIGYAHSQGVVHRDIKPGNIIVTPENKVKILDFGIARDETGHTITQSGQVVGTLQYASPEQIKGEKVDQRSDIYNLGMTLFEMVAGRLPHDVNPNSSSFHIMQRMLNDDVPDPRQFYPHIPENVVAAIFKAIDRDVDKRLHSIVDFIQILDGKTSSPKDDGIPSFTPPKAARLGEPLSHVSASNEYHAPVNYDSVSIDPEYEKLKDLQKKFPKFIVNRGSSGGISVINKVDGKKGVRITLAVIIVLFGMSLFGQLISLRESRYGEGSTGMAILIALVVLVTSIYFLVKFRFREESIRVSGDELMISSSSRNVNCKINDIGSISYSPKDNGIELYLKRKYSTPILFMQNSNSLLTGQFAYILSDIVKKLQK